MQLEIFDSKKILIRTAELTVTGKQNCLTCEIDEKIIATTGNTLSLRCRIPILDMHGYWTPEIYRPKMQLDWRVEVSCAAHRNFPYIGFFSQAQINRGAIGLTNLLDDAVITARMNQQNAEYDVEITISISSETSKFMFWADLENCEWTASLAKYRSAVMPNGIPSYPEAAWRPVYCTWYAVHASLEIAWMDDNVNEAAKMGFGTFIVDDGWCIDAMKRVSPETIGAWYDKIGDWKVSEQKLPENCQISNRFRSTIVRKNSSRLFT